MAYIKSKDDIEKLQEGGIILGEILETISKMVAPGVTALEIDTEAERLIRKAGGAPAFLGYRSRKSEPSFPSTICFSANEDLVHGVATKEKVIKKGDIISLDIGMKYKGLYTDTALSVSVGKISKEVQALLTATQKALAIGIAQAKAGNTVAAIGKAIQEFIDPKGYGIVRDLVGHGVGHDVHEEPHVPNFYNPELESWILEPGVVIAIEPMITLGSYEIGVAGDGWSISTKDKSLCAHYEHTIIVTDGEPIIATQRPAEK